MMQLLLYREIQIIAKAVRAKLLNILYNHPNNNNHILIKILKKTCQNLICLWQGIKKYCVYEDGIQLMQL